MAHPFRRSDSRCLASLAACGGGGDGGSLGNSDDIDQPDGDVELSLVEYFQQIDAIFEDRDKQLDELDSELQTTFDAATTVEAQAQALEDYANLASDVVSGALNEMEGLDTPEEVDNPHDSFVDALELALSATETLQDDLDGAETMEDLQLVAQGFTEESTGIAQQADDACAELQGIADTQAIAVDLNCEG